MSNTSWIRGYRLGFALLCIAAMAYQFNTSLDGGRFKAVNFFFFFTIESNLFASVLLIYLGVSRNDRVPPTTLDLVRGAATLYMTTTGVVYGLLLSGYQEELQTTIPWVDTVVHKVMPLVMLADWLIAPPAAKLRFKRALVWLVFPLVYCAVALIRGPIVNWYPYPFLNPDSAGGYAGVAATALGIALGVTAFTGLIVWTGNRLRLIVAD